MYLFIIHTYITEILKQKVLDLATTWNDPETEDRYALLKEVLLQLYTANGRVPLDPGQPAVVSSNPHVV